MLGGLSAYVTAHVIPLLTEKTANELGSLIVAIAATALPIIANIIRKWLGDTTPPLKVLIMLAATMAAAAPARADEVAVLVDMSKPGSYLLTIEPDGTVLVNPIRVIRPGQSPTPQPPVDPLPPLTPFELEIERATKSALSRGGSATTGAALSSVYSLVSVEVAEGRIAPTSALNAISAATNAVLAAQADRESWATWRTDVGGALTTLAQQGALTTKEQYAQALKEVSRGLDRATGNKLSPTQVLNRSPAALGILDGVDLAKLIELIKLVMELLKLFGPK